MEKLFAVFVAGANAVAMHWSIKVPDGLDNILGLAS